MRLIADIVGIGALVACSTVLAGNSSWQVHILKVENEPDGSAAISLHPDEPNSPWSGCDIAIVFAKFDGEPFWRNSWSKAIVTKERHQEALSRLSQAAKNGAAIRLGEMGAGLKKREDRPCEFDSRGLALIEELTGRSEVYSFYGAI